MRCIPFLLAWLPSVAAAGPGLIVAPPGAHVSSPAARVTLTHQGGQTTLTVAREVTSDATRLGVLLPLPAAPLEPPQVAWKDDLERIEAFGAPRIGVLTCDDLVVDTYYSIPPGCTSYEPVYRDILAGPPATGALAVDGPWAAAAWQFAVLDDDDALADWLDLHAMAVPDGQHALLAEQLDRGPLLAAQATLEVPPSGTWLSPIQVRYPEADLTLPTRLANDATPQDLLLTAIAERGAGAVLVDGHSRTVVENECLLDAHALAPFYGGRLDDALQGGSPSSWTLEYSGAPERCDPCVGAGPLGFVELRALGWRGEVEDAWVSRLRMRYLPGQVGDLRLRMLPHPPQQVRYVERHHTLEFAFPVCGEGFVDDPGVCPDLRLPEQRGCATGRMIPALPALLVGLLALARRRRSLAVVALALIVPVAHAGDEPPRPARELHVSTTLLSTDRVRFEDLERGGPHLLMPMIGVEGRIGLPFLPASAFGITGGVRGFWGNATPGEADMPVSFLFVEPHLGLDGRWGGPRPGVLVAPTARAGAQLAVGVLDASVWRPRASLGALLHVGAGAFVGTGPRPLLLELRGSVVPRTDGWGTSFHPSVRLPGWVYHAGSANLEVLVGTSFR